MFRTAVYQKIQHLSIQKYTLSVINTCIFPFAVLFLQWQLKCIIHWQIEDLWLLTPGIIPSTFNCVYSWDWASDLLSLLKLWGGTIVVTKKGHFFILGGMRWIMVFQVNSIKELYIKEKLQLALTTKPFLPTVGDVTKQGKWGS